MVCLRFASDLTETACRHYRAGDLPRAEQACLEVLHTHADNAEALNLLGIIRDQFGRHEEAIGYCRRATAIEPSNPRFHNNLGIVCAALGQWHEALAHYREALRLKPDFAEAHNNLGLTLAGMGRLADAASHYREALRLRPNYPEAHNNLGIALAEQQRFAEAVVHYREALRLRPDYPESQNNLGIALAEQGKLTEAEESYRRALRLNPGDPAALNNLAGVLIELGRTAEAVTCCRELLRRDPASAYAHLGELSAHGLYHFTGEQIADMENLLSGGRLSQDSASRLEFVLAALRDRQGEYDRAFFHYRRANDLKQLIFRRKNLAFDREKHRRFIDDIIGTFDRAFFERVRSFGVDTEVPVFVVGMPRTGSTLVAQILSSHPRLANAGELRDLGDIPTGRDSRFQIADCIFQSEVCNLQSEISASRPPILPPYPRRMSGLDKPLSRALAERYLQRLSGLGEQADRVVDKMPANYLHLGAIAALFPRARVIHCRRDPMDTCLSCYFQNFTWVNYACSLEDLGFYYRQYERLMRHWQEVLPLEVHEVEYEELVGNPERVSRELVAYCGLEWSDRCLAFHENAAAVQTASKLQVRRPIYASSLARWKRYESHLWPLKEALGNSGSCISSAKNTPTRR